MFENCWSVFFTQKSDWYFVEFFNARFILSVIIKFNGWYNWFVCRWTELIQWDSWGWECSVTVTALPLMYPSEPQVHHPFIIVRSESPTNSHTHIQPSCSREFYKSILLSELIDTVILICTYSIFLLLFCKCCKWCLFTYGIYVQKKCKIFFFSREPVSKIYDVIYMSLIFNSVS